MDHDLPATGEHGKDPNTASEADVARPAARTLNAAERRELRATAHHLDPVIMIGDAGLTAAVVAETDRALERHQLIKVRVLGDDRIERARILERLCAALGCSPVQMIGKLLVIWRPSEDQARGPKVHIPKKQAAQAVERSARQPKPLLAKSRSASKAESGQRPKAPPGKTAPTRARKASAAAPTARRNDRDTPAGGSRGGSGSRATAGQGRGATGAGRARTTGPSGRNSETTRAATGRGARPTTGGGGVKSRGPAAAGRGTASTGRPVSRAPGARKRRTHS